MGFSKKQKKIGKYQFLTKNNDFSDIFSRGKKIWKSENPKKIAIFRKIDRKSNFGVPIGLNHLVSENIGLGGHFGVFTTHTTHFFT